MADLATLGLVFETKGGEQAARVLEQVEQKAGAAERATDSLAGSQMRAGRATDELAGGAARTSRATDALAGDLNKATAATVRMEAASHAAAVAQTRLNAAQAATIGGARLATHEMINLSRQLGDVATMAAMGASPLMILTTQGAQIGEVFGVARQRGVGFTAALGQMGGAIGGVLVRLLPITLAVGAVVGAFALFERAVDKNTEGATTWGQTWQATVNVVGDAIMNGPIGEGLNWLGRMFGATLDAITGAVLSFADKTVGVFGAAYQLIVQNWRRLPQVFGVLMQATANAVIGRLENMINTGIAGINILLKAADVDPVGAVLLPRVKVADFERLAGSIESSFRGSRESLLAKIVAETERLAKAKDGATEAAGRHERALKAETAAMEAANPAIERSIRNLEMLAQRNAELTMSPEQKAMAEQRRLMAEAEAGGLAHVISATQILTDIEVERARVLQAISGVLITMPDSIRQGVGPADSLLQHFEEIEAATRSIRWGIDDVARSIEEKDWGSVFAGLMRTLERVRDLWNSGAPGAKYSATGAVLGQVGGAVGGTAGGVIGGVGSGFSAAGAAAAMKGMGGLAGAISGLAAPIGFAVAGFSLLNSVLSSDKAAKRAKREQEANDIANARAIALERANQRAALELELLRLSGDEVAYLAKVRENELSSLDSVSAAIQRQIHALEDWNEAVGKAEAALAQAQADLRTVYDREMASLQEVIARADVEGKKAQLRSAYDAEASKLQAIIDAVAPARAALEQAYNREKAAIEATASSVGGLIESLRDFRRELDLNPLAQGSLAQGRGAALAQFQGAAPEDAPGAGRAFLDASMASARTMLDYQRDRALVARAVDEMAASAELQLSDAERQLIALDKQVEGLLAANDNLISVTDAIKALLTAEGAAEIAEQQYEALKDQVRHLLGLNESVLSVDQAIDELLKAEQMAEFAEAQQLALTAQFNALMKIDNSILTWAQAVANLASATEALAAASAAKPAEGAGGAAYEAVGYEGYVQKNADLAALFASGTGMARGRSMAEFGAYHWERYGQGEDRFYRPFAAGGAFSGGMVSGPTAFPMGMMGEAGPEAIMPLANVNGRMGVVAANDGLKEEVRALRQEMTRVRDAVEKTARHTDSTNKVLGAVVRGDASLTTTSEAA